MQSEDEGEGALIIQNKTNAGQGVGVRGERQGHKKT